MTIMYLDIESIPSLRHDARDIAREGVKPPGTYKKPESIAEWWKTEGEAAIEEAYRNQALDASMGELCAIGYATDESEPVSLVRDEGEQESLFIARSLNAIRDLLDSSPLDPYFTPEEPWFIGHNTQFDTGFLTRRCWVNQVRPPFRIPGTNARDGKEFGDTMTLWAGYRGTISLDRLCRALGVVSPKATGNGSMVYDWWQAGDRQSIGVYNASDITATRECWHRMTWKE